MASSPEASGSSDLRNGHNGNRPPLRSGRAVSPPASGVLWWPGDPRMGAVGARATRWLILAPAIAGGPLMGTYGFRFFVNWFESLGIAALPSFAAGLGAAFVAAVAAFWLHKRLLQAFWPHLLAEPPP